MSLEAAINSPNHAARSFTLDRPQRPFAFAPLAQEHPLHRSDTSARHRSLAPGDTARRQRKRERQLSVSVPRARIETRRRDTRFCVPLPPVGPARHKKSLTPQAKAGFITTILANLVNSTNLTRNR